MKSVELERRLETGLVQTIFAPCARELMKFISKPCPPRRFLDVGCGSGIAARVAKDSFASLTHAHGFDFSVNAIKVANEVAQGQEFLFWTANAETFTVDQPYDAIVCQHTIQHVNNKREAMRHLQEALLPGGTLVLAAWPVLDECPAYDFLYSAARERDEKAKTLSTSLEELETYAREAALDVECAKLVWATTPSVDPEQFLTDYFESSAGWANETRLTLERPSLYKLAKRLRWSPENPKFKIGMNVVVARRPKTPAA